MTKYTKADDVLLKDLFCKHRDRNGRPLWNDIVNNMNKIQTKNNDDLFNIAMLRNRKRRVDKGEEQIRLGLAKNKCFTCGAFKVGHTCKKQAKTDTQTDIISKYYNRITIRFGLSDMVHVDLEQDALFQEYYDVLKTSENNNPCFDDLLYENI